MPYAHVLEVAGEDPSKKTHPVAAVALPYCSKVIQGCICWAVYSAGPALAELYERVSSRF